MKIKNTLYKLKYDNELKLFYQEVLICFDYYLYADYKYKHNKNNFLEKNSNLLCPNIALTTIQYILYGENKDEFKYLIKYICKNQNKYSIFNISYILQFFNINYAEDLTKKQQQQAKDRIIYYIYYILDNLFKYTKFINIDVIFMAVAFAYNKKTWSNKKIFLNIILKYWKYWKYIKKEDYDNKSFDITFITSQLAYNDFFTFIPMSNEYTGCYYQGYLNKYYLNKQKILQLLNKNII